MLRNREGFTLIELLIVVVIIGILAAIALPKFGQTREAAYFTTMKADLNNLRSAQEMYYQTSGTFQYATDLATLEFTPSSGVEGNVALTGGGSGNQYWGATATHDAMGSGEGCAILFGEVGTTTLSVPGAGTVSTTNGNVGAPVCSD